MRTRRLQPERWTPTTPEGLGAELTFADPGLPRLPGDADPLALDIPWPELVKRHGCRSVALLNLSNHLPLTDLRRFLHRASYLLTPGGEVRFVSRNPDCVAADTWPGEVTAPFDEPEYHRPLRHYLELLRLYPLRVQTPRPGGGGDMPPFLEWRATTGPRATADGDVPPEERYGADSDYRRFNRLEEPEILDDLLHAAARIHVDDTDTVLALGVNDGRELLPFREVSPDGEFRGRFWGIDHSPSAIETARAAFPAEQFTFICEDLEQLARRELPRFTVLLLLNVLHCTTVDRETLLHSLKPLLHPRCRVLVSIPNCHFGPGDILRRPLDRRDARHDRSLVYKDARALARWLYRAGFQEVETFGTYDLFLLARRR